MQQDALWPDIDYKKFKLIVSDIDGTLKDVLRPLDPNLQVVINQLKEAGVGFTVATGKNMKSTHITADALGIELPLILSNGCVIQQLDGRILKKQLLPEGFVDILIEVCEEEKIELAIHINEDIYVQKITHHASILFDYGSPRLIEVGEWDNATSLLKQAYKCIAIDRNDRQKLFSLEKLIKNLCGLSVEYCHTLVEMLEFMPQGVSKENGIQAITEELGISMSEVITLGDGNNDIGMLQAAGYGLAVANAAEEVKKAANWIIPSCANHGPLNFFEFLFSNLN